MATETHTEIFRSWKTDYGIPEYSESYPFLALARRRHLDYGKVLDYVHELELWVGTPGPAPHAFGLSLDDRFEIREEYRLEQERRARR